MKFKLVNIEINNFLSYKNASFTNVKGYNVLIGRNNVGKSNLFKLLLFLRNNINSEGFNKTYIFDENKDRTAQIILTFKLTKEYRRHLFKSFNKSNYFEIILRQKNFLEINELKDYSDKLKRDERLDCFEFNDFLLEWLIDQKFLNSIKLTFIYSPFLNCLLINDISIINKNSQMSVFKAYLIDNYSNADYHSIYKNSLINTINFSQFFEKRPIKKMGDYQQKTIINFFNPFYIINFFNPSSNIYNENFFIQFIYNDLISQLRDYIHLIPANRVFKRDYDKQHILDTQLSQSGENLVKFIYKQMNTNNQEWVDEWNKELRDFLPFIEYISQDSDEHDRTVIYLKEKGLDTFLRLENMGSGILNVAFFLAYLKDLERDKILLIEEPELFIFPDLRKKVRDKFLSVSDNLQIFISTHSVDFLPENTDISSVYYIEKEGNLSVVSEVPSENFFLIYEGLGEDIKKFERTQSLLNSDHFWIKFIKKILNKEETHFWDFKQTLAMWEGDKTKREEFQIKFCESVASFANANGGVIIIGITDKKPRKIVGISNLENRMESIRKTIMRWITYIEAFFTIKEFKLKDEQDLEKSCLILAIKETKKPISVKHKDKRVSFPQRLETGHDYQDLETLILLKKDIRSDNYHFLDYLRDIAEN